MYFTPSFTPALNYRLYLCFCNPGISIPVINPFSPLWCILHLNDFMKQYAYLQIINKNFESLPVFLLFISLAYIPYSKMTTFIWPLPIWESEDIRNILSLVCIRSLEYYANLFVSLNDDQTSVGIFQLGWECKSHAITSSVIQTDKELVQGCKFNGVSGHTDSSWHARQGGSQSGRR